MVVFLITVYQKLVSPALKQLFGMQSMCRFTPSCSEYAKIAITRHGVVKGSTMAFVQLMQCQPFSNTVTSSNAFTVHRSK